MNEGEVREALWEEEGQRGLKKEPQGTDLQAHSYPSGTRDGGRLVRKRLAQSSGH